MTPSGCYLACDMQRTIYQSTHRHDDSSPTALKVGVARQGWGRRSSFVLTLSKELIEGQKRRCEFELSESTDSRITTLLRSQCES